MPMSARHARRNALRLDAMVPVRGFLLTTEHTETTEGIRKLSYSVAFAFFFSCSVFSVFSVVEMHLSPYTCMFMMSE